MNSSVRFQVSAIILILFHIAGLIGLNLPEYAGLFEQLSWANMLLSFLLILWCDEGPTIGPLIVFVLLSAVIGLAAEIVGVMTGLIFGSYHYTPALNRSLMGVPVIIGINWTTLTYVSGISVSRFDIPVWLKVIIGAAIMTGCDILLERFAVKHHFWIWETGGGPPFRNFAGWFIISLLLHVIFQWQLGKTSSGAFHKSKIHSPTSHRVRFSTPAPPHPTSPAGDTTEPRRNRLAILYLVLFILFLLFDRFL